MKENDKGLNSENVYEAIEELVSDEAVEINLSEAESLKLQKIIEFLVNEDFQPKRLKINKLTAIVALKAMQDLGHNVKFIKKEIQDIANLFTLSEIGGII